MENTGYEKSVSEIQMGDTYDFANRVEQVKAIDLLMQQYFGADNWLPIRNRLFPGLRPTPVE